jgi:AAA-like domain/TIR domain/CHAT domain
MSVSQATTILILAANPQGTVPLRLDEEIREIREGLKRSRYREQFVVEYATAARPRDVQRAMLDYKPQVVHFCGHGEGERGLVLEDELGAVKLVSTGGLASLFSLFSTKGLNCVLLNACYSEVQAKAIAQYIPYVIGMNQSIGDRAAIEFATSFYDALGAGESVKFAYLSGVTAMQLQGIREEHTPVLITKSATPPKSPTGNLPLLKSEGGLQNSEPPRIAGQGGAPDDGRKLTLVTPEPVSPSTGSRIFISYKRSAEPDEQVALALYGALHAEHEVFIDQKMPVGTPWAQRIEAEIRQSDFLITLLSANSVHSEMVVGEIETAHHLSKSEGKPIILPIRVAYREAFAYPLSAYLNAINWAFWDSEADTVSLVEELQRAIAGQPLTINSEQAKTDLISAAPTPSIPRPLPAAQPALEMPEGTMEVESQFYVMRDRVDEIALATIQQQGVTITIKGPRQMGKSSLLIRTMAAAREAGKRVAFLDFQLFDKAALTNADRFFRQFSAWLTDELELTANVDECWNTSLGNSQCCTRYMQRQILKELGGPLVLAMDEVESVFEADFRTDFFSMLRSWHNNRATTPT